MHFVENGTVDCIFILALSLERKKNLQERLRQDGGAERCEQRGVAVLRSVFDIDEW
jgi:hypothetical protein